MIMPDRVYEAAWKTYQSLVAQRAPFDIAVREAVNAAVDAAAGTLTLLPSVPSPSPGFAGLLTDEELAALYPEPAEVPEWAPS